MTSIGNLQAKSIRDDLSEAVVSRFRPERILSQAHLRCLKCGNVLMPLPLDTDASGIQTIWWVCKSVKEQKCDFPATMPPDVFWVTRTPEEKKRDYMPHPRIELLPEKYRHYYPSIFKPVQAPPPTRSSATPDQASADSSATKLPDNSLKYTSCATETNAKRKMVAYASCGSMGTSSGSGSTFKHPASRSSGSSSISSAESAGLELDDGNETSSSRHYRRAASQRKPAKRRRDRSGACLTDVLAQELDKLDYKAIRDEDLVKIAEQIMEKVNSSAGNAGDSLWQSVLVNQDYYQVAREVFASYDFKEAKRSAVLNSSTDRVSTIYSLRNAQSGSDLLAAIGAGTPSILPPQSNSIKASLKERLESIMKQVALRKKAIDERLQIEVRGTARVRDAEESNLKMLSQSAGNSPKRPRINEIDKQRSDKMHEAKAQQLVRGKIIEVLEAKRQREVALVSNSTDREPTTSMDGHANVQALVHMHPSASAPEFSFGDIIEDPIDFPMTSGVFHNMAYQPISSQSVRFTTEATNQESGSFRDTAYDEENFDNFFGGDYLF